MIPLLAAVLAAAPGPVYMADLEGAINPIKGRYVASAIRRAEEANASVLILRLDTPGGLVDSMDDIVKAILASRRPVVAWVAPPGARAASAGALIVIAADVAAMAPTTNIGSAHPVAGGGQDLPKKIDEKMVNDLATRARNLAQRNGRNGAWAEGAVRESWNLTADEAKETGVIEIIAADTAALLAALDGYRLKNAEHDETIIVSGAAIVVVPMSLPERFLDAISNPNVAYILLSLGTLGLIYEFAQPGIGIGGVAGIICLLLALLALQALPINLAGLLLLVFGIGMLIAEIKVQSQGLLTVGGISALLFGSFTLFDSGRYFGGYHGLSWAVVLPVVAAFALTFGVVVALVVRTYYQRPAVGRESLVGMRGRRRGDRVFVDGALWDAVFEGEGGGEDEEVEVVRVDRTAGTKLVVRRVQ